MIYKQISYLPIIFQVDEGIILNVNDFLKRNKLLFSNVLVVSGASFSQKYASEIVVANNWNHYILKDNTSKDVDDLKRFVLENNIDLIVGVGGGKVIDTIKRVSYLTHINLFAIPTIISNDGLISPISVIKNKEGLSESLPGMMPMGVLIDIDIIRQSPINFIRAAAGDILSNISATNDWILAMKSEKDSINDIAFHLSRSAANSLVYYKEVDLNSKQFLRQIVQGQINSGISMALAGTSRPCSGSEHLISHAIDYLQLSENILHGTQVASISLFTLFLQEKLFDEYLVYAKQTNIPLLFTSMITDFSEELFLKIIGKAREMRPGRYTVLHELSDEVIYQKHQEFKKIIECFNVN